MRIGWEKWAQQLVRRMGFEVRRAAPSGVYVPQPNGYSTFCPWHPESGYSKFPESASPPDHIYYVAKFAGHCSRSGLDMAEFGVYKGGTARAILEASSPMSRLHLFDTFEGMPKEADTDNSPHHAGDFSETSLEAVRYRLAAWGHRCSYYAGVLPNSFAGFAQTLGFVHFDLDLYQSTLDTLRLVWPRVANGGVILFDDYGLPAYANAEKRAVDEFFSGTMEERPIVLASGQAFVIKLG